MRMPGFIAIMLLSACFLKAQEKAPDIILFNGKIWTGEDHPMFTTALAIKGNIIVKTGSDVSVKKLADRHSLLVNLKGRLVTAGINDAHIHFLEGSHNLTGVDLYASRSAEEALAAIDAFAKKHPEKK